MFLSIIIPVYNVEKYIPECLDSCLNQDIKKDDYEIICINDGSTDDSLRVLEQYSKKYANVHVISQVNGGVSSARNAGLEVARGDYVWYVDPDDFIQDNILGFLMAQANRSDAQVLTFRFYLFNNELTEEERKMKQERKIISNSNLCAPTSMLISRRFVVETGIKWRLGIEQGQDSIYIREIYLYNPAELKLDEALYYYRQQPLSTTYKVKDPKRRLHSHVEGTRVMYEIYKSPGGQCEANANILMDFLTRAMVAIARGKKTDTNEAFSQLKDLGFFPFKAPPECTKKSAFTTTRTDIVGKIYNYLCLKSHTRMGYFLLRAWYMLYHLRSSK